MNDRMENKAEDLGGRIKEAAGSLTDNDKLKNEGRADQASAGFKDKVEDVKDAIVDGVDKLRNKK